MTAGLLAAAALMLDYVLSSRWASRPESAPCSAIPQLQLTHSCSAWASWQCSQSSTSAVRESGVAFMLPTYLFIVSLLAVLAYGVLKVLAAGATRRRSRRRPNCPNRRWPAASGFSCGRSPRLYGDEGVEAVSNGVTAFREPAVPHARKTLTAIIMILAIMLAGIAFCAGLTTSVPPSRSAWISEHPFAACGRGRRSRYIYYITIGSVLCVLACRRIPALPTFPPLPDRRAGRLHARSFAHRGRRLFTRTASSCWPGFRPGC